MLPPALAAIARADSGVRVAKKGLYEYLKRREAPAAISTERVRAVDGPSKKRARAVAPPPDSAIDRTAKMFIGGKQARPDSGYSRGIYSPDGSVIGEVGEGNRKDIRNAVEAAHKASGWDYSTAHARAQILYYIAENLSARAAEFASRLVDGTGCNQADADAEVEAAIECFFTYAAWADKFDGDVHRTPFRGLTLAMPEPIGVMGVVCPDESPLLAFVIPDCSRRGYGEYGGRDTLRALSSKRYRPLPGVRDIGCSGRSDQYRHRSTQLAGTGPCRA